jgi:predicted nuclease of predicted toxin-antitoxin system
VKLLLDQNLSHRLVARLVDLFPKASHVRDFGLAHADDRTIWDYARINGFSILTKDGDFHQFSLVYGPPPKVVWLRVGNASTREIAELVRLHHAALEDFLDTDGALLVVDQ